MRSNVIESSLLGTVRSVFISDVHLGCKHSQADQLLDFLSHVEPEFLYLVGDIIDGRSLRRRWCWLPEFTNVIACLLQLTRQGTVVRYAIGNHDDFLRKNESLQAFLHLDLFEIEEEFLHTTQNNQRYLVLHGDRFDSVEQSAAWVSHLASFFYEILLNANKVWDRITLSASRRQYSLSSQLKRRIKSIVKYISEFETRITDHARRRKCHGVICGHIHSPVQSMINGLDYCNTGDWIENCTAVLEHHDGRLELIYFDELMQTLKSRELTTDVLDETSSESRPSLKQTSFRQHPEKLFESGTDVDMFVVEDSIS